MFSRLPIMVSAPLLIAGPVLIVGAGLSALWHAQCRSAVADLAAQNIEQVHDRVAAKVADVLAVPARVCAVNAHLVRTGVLDPADLPSWRSTLIEQARAFDTLSSIVWGSADGRATWISRYADGAHYWALKDHAGSPVMVEWRLDDDGRAAGPPANTFAFDLFTRPWYTAARDAGRAAWSDPYIWVGGGDGAAPTLGLSYGVPVFDGTGELAGVVDADLSVNDLSSFLRSIEIGKTGVAALATPDGRLLAVSDATPVVVAGERVAATGSPSPMIAAAARFFRDEGAVREGLTTLEIDGETHLVRATPIGKQVGLDWILATVVPEQDFIGEVRAGLQRSALVGLIAVGVAVVAGIGAARWLVKPIVTLAGAVRRIGEGELETRVSLSHAAEYTMLASEVNAMAAGLQDRLRMRESLALAMEVQRNLLPDGPPSVRGIDIAGHSTYCDETGGDYYDFLDVSGTDQDSVVIAIGDVMGHGVAAAMLMATARGILRSRCAVRGSLGDFLDHLNTLLVHDTHGERFMTMLLVTVSPTSRELRWASAGHGSPIVFDARADRFLTLQGGGVPLGILGGQRYDEHTEQGVGPGCIILAATDGLWETRGTDGKLFGMARLKELLRENASRPAEEIGRIIRETLTAYRGGPGPDDDLTFVVAKVV